MYCMGLFDDSTSEKGEVRIGVSEEEENESKLRSQVESKVTNSNSSSAKEKNSSTRFSNDTNTANTGSDTSLEDIEEQNQRIIKLLEQLVDEKGLDSTPDTSNDQGVRGGMDELL